MSPASSHVLVERLRTMLGLADVDEALLTRVVGDSLTLRWVGSSVIAAPGDPIDALYLVLSGAVEVVAGDEQVDELEPGNSFGGAQVVHGTPHEHTYVAAPECELLIIPREPLRALLDAAPGLSERLGAEA